VSNTSHSAEDSREQVSTASYENQQHTILPNQLPTTLNVQLVADVVPPRDMYQTMGEVQMMMGKIAPPQN